jgi:hypothetical protein
MLLEPLFDVEDIKLSKEPHLTLLTEHIRAAHENNAGNYLLLKAPTRMKKMVHDSNSTSMMSGVNRLQEISGSRYTHQLSLDKFVAVFFMLFNSWRFSILRTALISISRAFLKNSIIAGSRVSLKSCFETLPVKELNGARINCSWIKKRPEEELKTAGADD